MKKILTFIIVLTAMLALCTLSVFAAEAKIGETEYSTIAEAFDMAESGSTITLLEDVNATSLLKVQKGESFVLDLNGHTITAVDGRMFIISVEDGGSLTINDESNVGGILNYNARGYTIVNYGTLVINGGNFVGDYALYNGAYTNANANATLNGGTFSVNSESAYYSIANCSSLVVNGATVENWLNTSGNFTMTAGYVENFVAGNPDKTPATGLSTSIQGGTIATLYVGETNTVYVSDDVIIENVDGCAKVGNTYYCYLQDAIDAAQSGETVTLLCDIELEGNIIISKNSNVVLDLAGYTISQSVECTASYEMIANNGTLYITDSVGGGKISFTDTSAGDATASWGSYTIRNSGTLTIENVTIENLSAQNVVGESFKHATIAIFQYSGSCTINSGIISTPNYRSVRLWSGDMTINGGTFEGQVWVQCVNNTSDLTINGGSFAPSWNDGSSVFVGNANYTSKFAVTDGTFATKIGANDTAALTGCITGGTFSEAAINSMGTNSVLFAYTLADNGDGTYTVVPSLESAFTFLGYSVNENDLTSITAGFSVDQDVLALYVELNKIESFDFGCAFGIDSINESKTTSLKKYTSYRTFNAKIIGIDSSNETHINAALAMAMYVDIGNGKQYIAPVVVDGEFTEATQLVAANQVPTVTFKTYIPAE